MTNHYQDYTNKQHVHELAFQLSPYDYTPLEFASSWLAAAGCSFKDFANYLAESEIETTDICGEALDYIICIADRGTNTLQDLSMCLAVDGMSSTIDCPDTKAVLESMPKAERNDAWHFLARFCDIYAEVQS